MNNSKIEWTDDTDNPIRTKEGSFYCFKVSEACDNCYAENMARRLAGMRHGTHYPYKVMKQFPELVLDRKILHGWAKKTKPKKRFVTSMTDIAGEFVPDEWFFEILDAMYAAPLQTFQLLTKRAQRFEQLCKQWLARHHLTELPLNIWPGMTMENQRRFDERIINLLNIPSDRRWISIEPIGGFMDLQWPVDLFPDGPSMCCDGRECGCQGMPIDPPLLYGLAWVVVGGESGQKAKACDPNWVRAIRDQCKRYRVPFFFKQWGEWAVVGDEMKRIGKEKAGRILDGAIHSSFPGKEDIQESKLFLHG